jgi:hypothetical protein
MMPMPHAGRRERAEGDHEAEAGWAVLAWIQWR